MIYGDREYKPDEKRIPDYSAILQSSNLYGYCINNPVIYVDITGDSIILTLVIGAGIGALVSGGATVIGNLRNGSDWHEGLGIALLGGAVSGLVSAIPIPGVNGFVATVISGAAGSFAGQLVVGEIKSIDDVASALFAGAVAGIIGEGTAKIISSGVKKYFGTLTKSQQKAFLSNIGNITNRTLREIRQQLKNGVTHEMVEELIEKYGYETVISAFVSSTSEEIMN